ncbi:hypothetical protein [Marinobacter zhejiangensis]|uniref:Uncharacterized protein n=1 Tax=Marinobacter zhejiangensis TaxID=488535 RepID=A0A1I4TI41_9GAMM|nr:hypothetical protein [Marinobacter zhejiangensis]SFM76331.1 hypothetical protein SAMN04487963_3639 [Marinobacter zhejiangensis]
MNSMYEWLYLIGVLYVFFKAGQAIYQQVIWRRSRTSQRNAATEFKANNVPVSRLEAKNITSLARVLWNESLNGAVTNEVFHKEDIDPQVYRVFDFDITKKNWLSSNTAVSVSNTLNGFEFFIPSMARRWLYNTKPESIDIVFYKDIAILVGAANELDLFRERKARVALVPGLRARQTTLETWYEAPASCADFDVTPINGRGLIRAIEGDTMVLFVNGDQVDVHLFVIGSIGIFSGICALFGAAIVMDTSLPSFLSRLSFLENFLILLPVFWAILLALFHSRQHFKFQHKTIIFLNRKTSEVLLKLPGVPELKSVPWDKLMVRVSGQPGYFTGSPFSTDNNKVDFFSQDDPYHSTAEFSADSLHEGLGLWKTISMFMDGQIDSAMEIKPWGDEYERGDPQKDGLYLLKRRIKTTFPTLSLPAKALHFCLFLLTLGPLPYIVAKRVSDSRVRQAFVIKSKYLNSSDPRR